MSSGHDGKLEPPELLVDLAAKGAALAKQLLDAPDDVADAFGSELAQQMADDWGGNPLYFPKGLAYKVSKLHLDVWTAYDGRNVDKLVRQFKLSRVWIYKILKRMRAADMATRQKPLFPPPDAPN